jgi:hypothetical protein
MNSLQTAIDLALTAQAAAFAELNRANRAIRENQNADTIAAVITAQINCDKTAKDLRAALKAARA